MSWEKKPDGPVSWGQGVEGELRHPDGSPDIAAYGRIAHRERDAAILAAVQEQRAACARCGRRSASCLGPVGAHPVECAPPKLGRDEIGTPDDDPAQKKCCKPRHVLSLHGVVFAILCPGLAGTPVADLHTQAAAFGKL